jgi:YfiH family protein
MILAPNLEALTGIVHGFGMKDSQYPPGLVTIKQIHSAVVLETLAENSGLTASSPADLREGDALISNQPGTIVGIKTADCVPVLLADPVTQSVAAIHAGWRGTAAHIVEAAIAAMSAKWQTRRENLRAAIGPSIGPCCYEVGPEVAHQFGIDGNGTAHLDLPRENEKQLRSAGVQDIWVSGECTFCAAGRFFSWRRERERAGRMISFIGRI